MYLYHTLLFLQHRQPIVSLAILIDLQADWKPTHYTYEHWGCAVEFRYPVVKILDWRGREAELAVSRNPFAQVALAQLVTLTNRGRIATLAEMRRAIVRHLHRVGYSQPFVEALIRFMDWTMGVPEEIVAAIDTQVDAEEGNVAKVLKSFWEERVEAEATVQAQRAMVLRLLERRCGPLEVALRDQIEALSSDQVIALSEALLDFTGRDDLDRWLADRTPQ